MLWLLDLTDEVKIAGYFSQSKTTISFIRKELPEFALCRGSRLGLTGILSFTDFFLLQNHHKKKLYKSNNCKEFWDRLPSNAFSFLSNEILLLHPGLRPLVMSFYSHPSDPSSAFFTLIPPRREIVTFMFPPQTKPARHAHEHLLLIMLSCIWERGLFSLLILPLSLFS